MKAKLLINLPSDNIEDRLRKGSIVKLYDEKIHKDNNLEDRYLVILPSGETKYLYADYIELIDDNYDVENNINIDWEQRRYEIAKETFNALLISIEPSDYEIDKEDIIADSIYLADEFIKQLKKIN